MDGEGGGGLKKERESQGEGFPPSKGKGKPSIKRKGRRREKMGEGGRREVGGWSDKVP